MIDSEVKVQWVNLGGPDAGLCLIVKRPHTRYRRFVMLSRTEALMLARSIHETWGWPETQKSRTLLKTRPNLSE